MMYNPFSLHGKTILVTGASSGIGRSVAIECSRIGAIVVITGRDEARLTETFSLLEGDGHFKIIADLTNENDLLNLIDQSPLLDGIVHSAGISRPLPFRFIKKSDIELIFQPNFIAPVILSQSILKTKKLNNGGSVIFLSSISGVNCTSTGGALYSASKGAINAITKTMALELSTKEIRVNCINPGMIETNILDNSIISDDQLKDEIKKYPLKRFGKPSEIAFLAIYLLSDASRWITGSNIVIDGGYTIQ